MHEACVWPVATTIVAVIAGMSMLAVPFLRLAKAKGFADALPWMIFFPMALTKAIYMFMLALIAADGSSSGCAAFLPGASGAFALVVLLQCLLVSRRMARERLALDPGEAAPAPARAGLVRGNLPAKILYPLVACGALETFAVLALVASVVLGRQAAMP